MKKSIISLALLALITLCTTTIALAAKPTAPVLTAITVAVDGLQCQGCVDELKTDLGKATGVSEVNVTQTPAQVTVKLDERTISAAKFVTLVGTHRQFMDHAKTYGAKLVLYIDAAGCANDAKMCASCFTEIPKVLKAVKGVSNVTLDETGKIAAVSLLKNADFSTSVLTKALARSDYQFTVTFIKIKTDAPACMAPETAANPGMSCPSCAVAP